MKTKLLIVPICAALAFTSCQKEKSVPLSANTGGQGTTQNAAHRTGLLSYQDLYSYLPSLGANFTESRKSNADGSVNEVTRVYTNPNGRVYVSIGDFVNDDFGLLEILRGRGVNFWSPDDASQELPAAGIRVQLESPDATVYTFNALVAQTSGDGVLAASLASGSWEPDGFLAQNALSAFTPDAQSNSSIAAYANDSFPGIRGWVIYDGISKNSSIILSVPDSAGDRIAYIIEESGAISLSKVNQIVASLPFAEISDL